MDRLTKLCILVCIFLNLFSNVLCYRQRTREARPRLGQPVRVHDGTLMPLLEKSRLGNNYYSYMKIPYAEPPVGQLRFMPPVKSKPWEGVRDAVAFGPACAQFDLGMFQVTGEEDCLYLNVFKPERYGNDGNLPVMVFFHNGAFMFASSTNYRADYFMDEPVILVTVNFRVGVLGFLNAGIPEAQGNMGLKDQVMALKWVQENIARFGGDPNMVTIFGDLAGGAAVHHHMYSPMSKGLFSAAISQGGTALCSWAYIANPRKAVTQLSNFIGCPTTNMHRLVRVLKTLNTTAIVGKIPQFFEFGVNQINPFGITVETAENGFPTFLSTTPYMSLQREPVTNVPWITGFNDNLGLVAAATVLTNPNQTKEVNSDWHRLAPLLFYFRDLALDRDTVSALIKQEYFGNSSIDISSLTQLANLYSDRLFLQGDRKSIMSHFTNTLKNSHPTYLYQISHRSNNSFARITPLQETLGVTESDELQYLFNSPNFFYQQTITPEHPHFKFSANFVRLWVHFATHRTTDSVWNDDITNWQPANTGAILNGEPFELLDINRDLSLINEPFKSRLDFWDSLPINEYENEIITPS